MRLTIRIALIALAVSSMLVWGEDFQLKDGTKIAGTLISINGNVFRVKTAYGEVEVPRSQVVSITFPENQPKSDAGQNSGNSPVVDQSLHDGLYTNRTVGFQVAVPQSWELAPELMAQTPDVIGALKSDDQTLFLLVTPEKFSGNLTTYRVLVETQYQTKFKDYEKLSESNVQMDGKTSLRLIWHGKNTQANDMLVKAVVYIIPYEGRMLRLSFLTLEPLFNDALPVFEKIAASYKTIDPAKQAADIPKGDLPLSCLQAIGGGF